MSKFNEPLFIEKFNNHTGGKYRYLGYHNGLVEFLCEKHQQTYYDTPSHLLANRGCRLCGKENKILVNTQTKEEFVKKANIVHKNKYDYSKAEYKKASLKVCIICPEHGEFWQTPNSHLNGNGCPQCATKQSHDMFRKTREQFILDAQNIHGNTYDYSKVDYINTKTKVCIICPKHGEFWQTPMKHLRGQGCPECGKDKSSRNQGFTTETFIEKAKLIHGDKYDYSKTVYNGYDVKTTIICPIHGEFEQTPDSHLQGSGCQRCARRLSINENVLYEFLTDKLGDGNVLKSNRDMLPNHAEIDLFIPSLNLGIEYDGCRWHTEQFGKTKYYHLNKSETCEKSGITLIHIFEDEFTDKRDIVLNKITNILGVNNAPKINARNCTVKEVVYADAKVFLDQNHIQGSQKSSVYLGAFYNDKLVGVMTFIKTTDNKWEMNRFATDINYICRGVASKLFNFFIKTYQPNEIKTFLDRRWAISKDSNLYTTLGFKLEKTLEPDYRYVIDGQYKRIHKFNFRKQILHKKYGFPLTMTENEMAEQLKAHKIWDCGLYKYVWTKDE